MSIVLDGSNLTTTGVINSATAKTATGTAVDFTGIPAGTKRITANNTWVASGITTSNDSGAGNYDVWSVGGNIALSGTLDRVRITTVNGTDTFDAGSINILYE